MSFTEQLKDALRIMVERKRGNYNNNWYREASHSMPTPNRYHQLGPNYQDYTQDPYPYKNRTPWDYGMNRGSYHHRDMNYNPDNDNGNNDYTPPRPGNGVNGNGKKKVKRRK